MDFTTGFYQPDLSVHYEDKKITNEMLAHNKYWKTDQDIYRLFYLYSGQSNIVVGNAMQTINSRTLVIAKPGMLFLTKHSMECQYEYLIISLLPSIFSEIIGDNNFLRCFEQKTDDELIIVPETIQSSSCFSILDNFKRCLLNHGGRIHIISRIFSIISELDFYFDNKSTTFEPLTTDNVSANLIEYLINHCTEKITLENLESIFSLSSATLNRLCKNSVNCTVYDFVIKKRLNIAQKMIEEQNTPISKISELCGFSDYTAFFKSYKRRFGISPRQHRNNFNK